MWMKHFPIGLFLVFFVFHFAAITGKAQNCIEVETILANSCDDLSSPEGLNEMFRFRVGANPINITEIQIVNGWPSVDVNPQLVFGGFVQNAQTANKTVELNSTISNICGFLQEPPQGVIPANARVLAITSFEVSAALNSFANLTDTLFVIYQQHSGQTGGHFLNYNAIATPQEQTLRIQINGANPCYEEVTYIRGNLVTTAGVQGDQNGAFVDYTPDGTPTYGNTGCQAPFEPFSAEWTNPGPLCQTNAPINLNNLVTGTSGGTWTGPGITGSTFNPSQVSGQVSITYTVDPTNDCNPGTASVTQTFTVSPNVDASFTNPEIVCGTVGTLALNSLVTGTPGGTWSGPGVFNGVINVSGFNGDVTVTYTVGSGVCTDTESQTFQIINLATPIVTGQTVFCNGETPTPLSAQADPGATTNWFADNALNQLLNTGNTFSPPANQNATFWVNQTAEGCSSDSVPVSVEFSVVAIPTADTFVVYCEGEPIPSLSASGSNLTWYSNSTLNVELGSGNTYTPTVEEGEFYVTATEGSCESAPIVVELQRNDLITAQILPLNGTSLCEGGPLSLESSESTLNTWNTGAQSNSIQVNEAGTYILSRTGLCNTASDTLEITGLPVVAEFSLSQDSGYTVLPVEVTSNSLNAETCVWTLNDSVLTDFSAPGTLVFSDSGTYVLQLACTNSSGCTDTTSQVIKVLSDQLVLVVPNVFSPNGDGINDLFQVKHNAVKTFNGRVFNRWGKLLFEWNEVSNGWNGALEDNDMTDGTYFYMITGTDIKDVAFEKKGVVTLIRSN